MTFVSPLLVKLRAIAISFAIGNNQFSIV
jgi:hypothetical protein